MTKELIERWRGHSCSFCNYDTTELTGALEQLQEQIQDLKALVDTKWLPKYLSAKQRIEELEAHLAISKGKHENCIRDNERLRGAAEKVIESVGDLALEMAGHYAAVQESDDD